MESNHNSRTRALINAKKMVKELTQQTRDIKKLSALNFMKPERQLDLDGVYHQNADTLILEEVLLLKKEIYKINLDVASVSEEKSQAQKDMEASHLRMRSSWSSINTLQRELEEVIEEQVLLELARIEAVKEFGSIEVQRKERAKQFSSAMDRLKERRRNAIQEVESAKELQNALAATVADINMLQNELKQVKQVRGAKEIDNPKLNPPSESRWDLQAVREELASAKDHLNSVRGEGFQSMASMDIIREELNQVVLEIAKSQSAKDRKDIRIQNLRSKLLRAKSKLKAASVAEEKNQSILSNLSLTLKQLQAEAAAAKKEKEFVSTETTSTKAGIQEEKAGIDSILESFEAAMQELEAAKSSEAAALQNLRILTEKTMRERAFTAPLTSSIIISKFEYEYLIGHAGAAERIADKKVAAAQAWTGALQASEKEMMLNLELIQKQMELWKEEQEKANRTDSSLGLTSRERLHISRGPKRYKNTQAEDSAKRLEDALPRQTVKKDSGNNNLTPTRRAKLRGSVSVSPSARSSNTGFTVKKRRIIMPNIGKMFLSKRIDW